MKHKREHALVIGGGIAGLMTARVLARHFERVTLLERDELTEDSALPDTARRGLPQAAHNHIILAQGMSILERLFPGLGARLVVQGGLLIDVTRDFSWHIGPRALPRFDSGIQTVLCSRELLDREARAELVRALPGRRLTILTDREVTGLLTEGTQVCGVRTTSGELSADFVVDASGRMSRAPDWLAQAGWDRPQETLLNPGMGVASRVYRCIRDERTQWKVLMNWDHSFPTRMSVISEIEGDNWIIGFNGVGPDYPPHDERGFLEYSRNFANPLVYDLLSTAEPLTGIHIYRKMDNRWRHFEKMRNWPRGLVVLGDAFCTTNPRYSFGVSASALGVELLESSFAVSAPFEQQFQKDLATVNADLWRVAHGGDSRLATAQGDRTDALSALAHRYFWEGFVPSLKNPENYRTFVQVLHLLRSPYALFSPRQAPGVIRAALSARE